MCVCVHERMTVLLPLQSPSRFGACGPQMFTGLVSTQATRHVPIIGNPEHGSELFNPKGDDPLASTFLLLRLFHLKTPARMLAVPRNLQQCHPISMQEASRFTHENSHRHELSKILLYLNH